MILWSCVLHEINNHEKQIPLLFSYIDRRRAKLEHETFTGTCGLKNYSRIIYYLLFLLLKRRLGYYDLFVCSVRIDSLSPKLYFLCAYWIGNMFIYAHSFLLATRGKSDDHSVYAMYWKFIETKCFFFLLDNNMGLFYFHCKEQRDLCMIHCTLHIHLFNVPYGIYAFGAVYGVQNICKGQNIGI